MVDTGLAPLSSRLRAGIRVFAPSFRLPPSAEAFCGGIEPAISGIYAHSDVSDFFICRTSRSSDVPI